MMMHFLVFRFVGAAGINTALPLTQSTVEHTELPRRKHSLIPSELRRNIRDI